MELPNLPTDLSAIEASQLRALRVQYLAGMEANRTGQATTHTFAQCVAGKNACNEELRRRGEAITASGISTPESRARAITLRPSQEVEAELKIKDAEIARLKSELGNK